MQIKKGQEILKIPSKAEIIKRTKFLTSISKDETQKKFELNQKPKMLYKIAQILMCNLCDS